jgi:hypothetical protein
LAKVLARSGAGGLIPMSDPQNLETLIKLFSESQRILACSFKESGPLGHYCASIDVSLIFWFLQKKAGPTHKVANASETIPFVSVCALRLSL